MQAQLLLLLALVALMCILAVKNPPFSRRQSQRLRLLRESEQSAVPSLPTELMDTIFSLLTANPQPDPATRYIIPQIRQLNRESRSIIDQYFQLWKFKIFYGCYYDESNKYAARALFQSNALHLRDVRYGDRCFQAIQAALEPETGEMHANWQTQANIYELIWEDQFPSRQMSWAFMWILRRVYGRLQALTIEAYSIFETSLLVIDAGNNDDDDDDDDDGNNDDQEVEEGEIQNLDADEANLGNSELSARTRLACLNFWEIMFNLPVQDFTTLRLNLNGLIRAYIGQNQDEIFRIIERLPRLKVLHLWETEATIQPLQDFPWAILLGQALRNKQKLEDVDFQWISHAQGTEHLMVPLAQTLDRLRYLTISGRGAGGFINALAPYLPKMTTSLRGLRLYDTDWQTPLPRQIISTILTLSHLRWLVLPQMHEEDIVEWRFALAQHRLHDDLEVKFTCDETISTYGNVWQVGFENVQCFDNPVSHQAIFSQRIVPGMQFISDREIKSSMLAIDEMLPDRREHPDFLNLQSLDSLYLSPQSAWNLANRLRNLPELQWLSISVRPLAVDDAISESLGPNMLRMMLEHSPLKKLVVRMFAPLIEPGSFLELTEEIAALGKQSRLEQLDLQLAFDMRWKANWFSQPELMRIKVLTSKLQTQTNLQSAFIKYGYEMIDWKRN